MASSRNPDFLKVGVQIKLKPLARPKTKICVLLTFQFITCYSVRLTQDGPEVSVTRDNVNLTENTSNHRSLTQFPTSRKQSLEFAILLDAFFIKKGKS